ncbi:unnamed protein product [Withania somnifera]
MVSLKFSSFMLAMVLFIFVTIKGSIAYSDDQATQTLLVHEAENGYTIARSVAKDVLDDVEGAVEFTKGKMGGRKMLIETKNVKEKIKEVEATEEADSKNSTSGAASASTHSVGNLKYHKGQGKLRELSGNRNSPSNRPLDDSRKNIRHQMQAKRSAKHNSSFQKLKLREDATEFFTMMNKDYIGGPGSGSKPHHKPPINNFQTSHISNP